MADIMKVALRTMGKIKRRPGVEREWQNYSFHFCMCLRVLWELIYGKFISTQSSQTFFTSHYKVFLLPHSRFVYYSWQYLFQGQMGSKDKWLRCGIWHSAMANHPRWLPVHFSTLGLQSSHLGAFQSLERLQIYPGDGYWGFVSFHLTTPRLSLGQVRFISFQKNLPTLALDQKPPKLFANLKDYFKDFASNSYFLSVCIPCSFVYCLPDFMSITCFRLSLVFVLYLISLIIASFTLPEKKSSFHIVLLCFLQQSALGM